MAEPTLLAVEAKIQEDTPYFFQRIGELALETQQAGNAEPENTNRRQRECIATAPHHGVVAAAGESAIYVASIDQLLSSSVKGADEEAVAVADSSKICAACIDACHASVHISSNGLLLAVCEDSRIRTWAIRDLLSGNQDKMLCEWTLGDDETVKQFSWRPAQAAMAPAEAFVVTDTGRLLNAELGGQLASNRESHLQTLSCAAWSPDGSMLAFASGSRIIVAAADDTGHFRATAKIPEAEEDGLKIVISTMAWAGMDALVLACSLYSNDDDDDDDPEESCSVCILHWSSWKPGDEQDPLGLELVAMSEFNSDPNGQSAGSFHQSLVSLWGVAVAAHGKANDNHIIVLEALPTQQPQLLEILDDSLAIRIPLAADYTDNFVTGLGFVMTSTEEVYHPDPEHGKLPPQPILVVVTSDGALRLFTFASLKRSAGSITHAAYSYDDAPYPVVLQAAAEKQDSADVAESARGIEQQQSADKSLSSINSAAASKLEPTASALPQIASSREGENSLQDAPSAAHSEQPADNLSNTAQAADGAEAAASKTAAIALPDSESDEEDSQESSTANSSEESSAGNAWPGTPPEPHRTQPQLASIAQAAGRAAATALPDSDEEAEEELESQASVSITPPIPPQACASAQGLGQARRGAALSQAAESAAPGRRLGRLDSLSTSDTESVEVQSRPEDSRVPAPPPAKEAQPSSLSWPSGTSSAAFGQLTGPSSRSAAAVTASHIHLVTGATAPVFSQVPSTSKVEVSLSAPGAAFPMARHSSSALPAPVFGQALVAPARQPSGSMQPSSPSVPRPAQAPPAPRQSAAQLAIARAREEALASKASRPATVTSAAGLPSRRPSEGASAAPSEPPPPKARLQEEGKELASMEREFLKSLAETRAIEAKLTAEMRAAEGADSRNFSTRKGALALQGQVQKLADRVGKLRAQLASDRAHFSALHRGWKDDRARAEALLFFNGKRDFLDEDEAVYASADMDPAILELLASIQEHLPLLQKQAAQLSDCIEAVKARAGQGQQDGPLAMQRLYNALNLQKEVALFQVTRVQKLWDKMQQLGLSDMDPSKFDSLQQLQKHGTPAANKKASRSPYERISRSPWSQAKEARSRLLLPGNSGAVASKRLWAGDSAAAVRALLLEKVTSQDGGVRLTRSQQTNNSERAPAPSATHKRPGRPKDRVPTLSSLQLHGDSGGQGSPADASSKQHEEHLHPRSPGSEAHGSSSAPHRRLDTNPERKATPARPDLVSPYSSAETSSKSEGQTTSPPHADAAAMVSRPHDHSRSSAELPEAAQSTMPSPVVQENTASKTSPVLQESQAPTRPLSSSSSQPAAKMPPVPSKAAQAAAQARSAAALSSLNARADKSRAAKPVEATAQSASAAPQSKAAAMPPVPSKAALAAAQAQGQAMLSGQKAKAASAKMPPVPSKAALAAAEAKGQAALNTNKQKPATEAISSVPQMYLSAGIGAASSSGEATPLSFLQAPSASQAAPLFGATSASAPFTSVPFGTAATGAPASFQLASSIAAPLSGSSAGAFSFSGAAAATAPAATPAPMASAMSLQQPVASSAPSQSVALAFPGLSAGSTSQAASGGSTAPSAATVEPENDRPAETLAAGFGAFGGLGQQASATPDPGASPFGKGLSFSLTAAPALGSTGAPSFMAPSTAFGGGLAASSPAAPFPAFGQPAIASAAATSAFGSSGQGTSAAASETTILGQNASMPASAPSPFGGFGAPAGFGQSATQPGPPQGLGSFGLAASITPGFGTPATPGFGQAASPAFGAPAAPGFGSPGAAAFGVAASPAAPFGAHATASVFGGGFAAAANQGGGFGSLAQGPPNAFGAAAQQSPNGFGAFGGGHPQSGGFSAFGGTAAPLAPKAPPPQGGGMWAPRK